MAGYGDHFSNFNFKRDALERLIAVWITLERVRKPDHVEKLKKRINEFTGAEGPEVINALANTDKLDGNGALVHCGYE